MVMIDELSYFTVSSCLDSWEALHLNPNYAEELGKNLLIKFFVIKPEAKKLFGFNTKSIKSDDDLFKCPRFLAHGKYFVQILDKVVDMLGPDLDMLTEILLELGDEHKERGVKTEWFPIMGVALLECMADMLGPKIFSTETKQCWLEVYKAITDIIILGYSTERKGEQPRRKSTHVDVINIRYQQRTNSNKERDNKPSEQN
jgi:hemoglobin-like flavoprotein